MPIQFTNNLSNNLDYARVSKPIVAKDITVSSQTINSISLDKNTVLEKFLNEILKLEKYFKCDEKIYFLTKL